MHIYGILLFFIKLQIFTHNESLFRNMIRLYLKCSCADKNGTKNLSNMISFPFSEEPFYLEVSIQVIVYDLA